MGRAPWALLLLLSTAAWLQSGLGAALQPAAEAAEAGAPSSEAVGVLGEPLVICTAPWHPMVECTPGRWPGERLQGAARLQGLQGLPHAVAREGLCAVSRRPRLGRGNLNEFMHGVLSHFAWSA